MDILYIITLVLFLETVYCNIDSKLYYYETLSKVTEIKRVRRSLDGSTTTTTDKDIKFNAFGRSFELILENNADILSQDFKAVLIRKDGSSTRVNVRKNELFRGHLAGEGDSLVDATREDGIWIANIYTKQDSYHIEPSWRHLPISGDYSYIAYRGSDIKRNISFPTPHQRQNMRNIPRRKLCEGIHVDVNPDDIIDDRETDVNKTKAVHHRKKRQGILYGANSCQLYVVADHLFHSGIGSSRPHTTVNYLINTFQAVDSIFRSTLWDKQTDMRNIGFQLKEMKIHEQSTQVDSGESHYNMHKSTQWETRDLLEIFSRENYHQNFCLAHLFTYQKFKGGVLGLAYIASPRRRTVGGICSPSYVKDTIRLTLNSGWSSSMNTNGDRLLTQEANLVTAHELGHNWGSEHDAETSECAPSSITGSGKYIMYPYAVDGYEDNNRKFSPCSQRYVFDVLKSKASVCFTAQTKSTPYCGNGVLDTGEECDGGKTGKEDKDACCTPDCKLKGNAICSSMNYECCKDCKIAPVGTICRQTYTGSCEKQAACNGTMDCPKSEPADEDTDCLEGGKCRNGKCVSYCERAKPSKLPCRCQNEADACYRCCKSRKSGKCERFGDEILPDGRACYRGFCKSGQCKKSEQNLVQRLFSFIEKLTPNAFVEFMKSNIVGTIIIFSMVIWIPASWTFSCIVSIIIFSMVIWIL
ncbi:ADAM 17-like protease [Patella vulgata]|uniref:ADAM 17-like protease n=1 Tax=Patella vulgata TaxID=6465 RepID=UPI0024A99573|nr:ADAM 17-like protease [Patella vulgata]